MARKPPMKSNTTPINYNQN
jgi:hypothetical protein